ncbi:PP2C family protein-serine/threonine phosphatase, partial [Aquabacterium sp.]|uniref:PP2C family protein-serine/threonine phosphatase n=1 Tax=Aquabacterium sp. TaxID=1872578 RepID=UPI002D0C9CC5
MSGSTPITPLEPMPPSHADSAPAGAAPAASGQCTSAWARIDYAVATACGLRHRLNEDAHSPPALAGRLFVVADGVGGGALARTASRLLVARLHRALDGHMLDAGRISRAVLDADRAIARHLARRGAAPGAATVALCAPANRLATNWWIAWVGDCRVYRIAPALAGREGRAEALTRDDSFRAWGEWPPEGSTPDDPARMVGNGATSGANVVTCTLAAGELLALCSDGVHKHVDEPAFGQELGAPGPLAQRCEALLALARRNGSTDDATVMLLR